MSGSSKIFLLGFILIYLAMGNCLAFEKNPPTIVFWGNRELSPTVKFIEQNKVLYINHSLLEEIFKTKVEWEISKGLIKINLDNFKIQFQVGPSLLNIDGEKYQLKNPLFEQENNLWCPLEFYQLLGIEESSRENHRLKLMWKKNYLLGLNSTQFQGRSALELVLTGAVEFKNFLLTKPDRLVCQFPAIEVHPTAIPGLNSFRNDSVKRARFNRDDTGLLTLAFDLGAATGYEVIPDPDFPGRVLLVFDYFLEDLSLLQQGDGTKVNIKTSAPANFKILNNNDRNLVVDFDNVVLKTRKRRISGDGDLIKEIFLEQIEADKVRMSVTLLKDEELFIIPALDDPNLLQVRTVQFITGIDWRSAEQGSTLVVNGDGELTAKIHKVSLPNRIQIDFESARIHPDLALPDLSGAQGRAIHLKAISSNQVRLELDLNYFLGYQSEFTPDKRQLRIVLQDSPLLNKTFIVDPGHGGQDHGATGKKGTLEKDLNLEVSLRLKDLLEEAGAKVVLTRIDDIFISLYERAFLANILMADYFISVHANSHPSAKTEGIEVFYYPNHSHSRPLATNILDSMVRETGLKKLAVKTNNFAVIRETQMPGVLLELGFLSNAQEELTLRTDDYKNNAARGIFRGVIDFLH